ncbi:MAG TPA: hypothetical protein VL442_01900 [Mucilaginibacter sp.]|nr:hypothetical protein [Mucilaginibacter sp.]
MKTFTLLLILSGITHLAFAQQMYVSKQQIKIGKYENGQVPINTWHSTIIFKTDFDFKHIIGSRYTLTEIDSDNKVSSYSLILKKIKYKRTEKAFEFAVK